MNEPSPVHLRRGVLAVSVLRDVDLEPAPLGVALTGRPTVWVSWQECREALGGQDPEGEVGRERLARWLLARRWSADVAPDELVELLRPVGLPVGHLLHPGPGWVRERVLGGALELGLGAVGIDPSDPDAVVVLPPSALDAAGVDAGAAWLDARTYLEDMGALAAQRAHAEPRGLLRPVGDCDVVTLLGARSLRRRLAGSAGGLCPAVVPMRRRGWTRLGLLDPAFAPAAAAATGAAERGFPRPLLLTTDEVALVAEGGRPADLALSQPAAPTPWSRPMRYS